MKKQALTFGISCTIILASIIASCTNQTKKSSNPIEENKTQETTVPQWYDGCDGLSSSRYKGLLSYGPNEVVGSAALKLLRNQAGSASSYRFYLKGPVEVRNNCEFIVPMTATADIGAPEEKLRVRVGWDGVEFYLK